ncbi:MAG: AMP-binding protein [Saprospiraceae bacterium]|nr:AMP-binding protein [Saprospiraceae bacterium]
MSENKVWLENYPSGVPVKINPDAYTTLVDMIEETFKKYPDQVAFKCMGAQITFKQLDNLSYAFGAYLQQKGLEKGDKIALMMPNLIQYPIALFGALRAGLVVVNTNPLYTAREMHHQFKDSGAKAIVICENFAHNLEKIIPDTGIKNIVVTSIGELLGGVKGVLTNFVVRKVKKMVPPFKLNNTDSFKEALAQGKKYKLNSIKGESDDVILLQYTGGTTGVSKGAMLTNKNLVSNMLQIRSIMMPFLTEKEEVALSPLPMYHIFAFVVNALALMSIGTKTVLITNPRDLKSVVTAMKSDPPTLITGVNTLFNALINFKDFTTLDFSKLKVTVGGGMAVQRPVAEKWQKLTGCPLSEGYGMTEASPVISCNPLDETGQIGTIGMPVPSTEVRLVDEAGNVLPQGEIGEIQVKGPQVMKGYYNRPEETADTIKDGWLCTGDIGVMQKDGFFKIVDRKKDMILVSGFNVYPNEIEDFVATNEKVLEVAAIGVEDEKSGEVVKIFVVKKDNSLNEKELKAFCKEGLTGYKVPKHIEFKDELPKTNVGKILRRALRESN